jgi:glycosyltransferase involved in cell wall biosynthesis
MLAQNKMRLLFVVNDAAFFVSHRLPLALAAQRGGYEVHVATPQGPGVIEIELHGISHHAISLARSGKEPIAELGSMWAMFRLFRRVKPDLVHLVSIKPVLYGGIAARLARVRAVVAAVSGLGFVFIRPGPSGDRIRFVVARLYRFALRATNLRVICQNLDDREALVELGAVTPEKVVIIRGSGVDVSLYKAELEPEGIPVITMAARLLVDKGVFEFVEAARLLKAKGVIARFWLVGDPDPGNPASIGEATIETWKKEGCVELLGSRQDIPSVFARSSVVSLPSYREGLPKVLLEAAACGRPVVTCDVPGCRDAIEAGVTGLLVPARDANSLAIAIRELIEDEPIRRRMGRAGRQLAEREFAIEKIVDEHLAVYETLMQAS